VPSLTTITQQGVAATPVVLPAQRLPTFTRTIPAGALSSKSAAMPAAEESLPFASSIPTMMTTSNKVN
jgi:hypothetical protein